MSSGWAGSTRNARLPSNWKTLRAAVLKRDNYQCRMLEDGARCETLATDVDHVIPSGADGLHNLVSLCTWHHQRKTAQEGNEARTRQRREPESHPGAIEM